MFVFVFVRVFGMCLVCAWYVFGICLGAFVCVFVYVCLVCAWYVLGVSVCLRVCFFVYGLSMFGLSACVHGSVFWLACV